MKYLISYVQKPTTPPAPVTPTVGSVQVAHRRKNLSGGYSEATILSSTSLPNTFVFQGYNDSPNLAGDEILVKVVPGNWYKVPASNISGLNAAIPNPVPTSWETVTDAELSDSQALFPVSNLDFGSFNSSSEPAQTVFLLNDGSDTITGLDFAVNAIDGQALGALDQRVRVDYEGVLGAVGVGNYDTAANGSLVFSLGGRNGYLITIGPDGVAKITLNLVNFPASGLDSLTIGAEFVFNPNRSGFALPTFLEWEDGALLLSSNSSINPVSDDPNSLGVLVSPLTARVGNLVYQSSVEQVVIPSTVTTGAVVCNLFLTQAGVIGASEDPLPAPTGSVTLGTFDYNTTSGTVDNWKLSNAPQNPSYYLEPDAVLTVGRSVQVNSSGFLVHGGDSIGVASNTEGNFVPFGWAQCEVGGTVTKGQTLAPNSLGIYNPSSEGRAVAQESGEAGDLVTCFLLAPVGDGGGGTVTPGTETDLSVARGSSTVTVESSTGTNAIIPAASVMLAGALTASDKSKLDGIQTGATVSNLTVSRNTTSLTVENSGGSNGSLLSATPSLAGVMTASDKSKLDGIQTGATVSNLGVTLAATSLTLTNSGGAGAILPIATTSDAGLMSASDKTDLDALVAAGPGDGGGATNLTVTPSSTSITVVSSTGTDGVIGAASPSLAGVMTAADKTKLNGIATGATANSSDSFLLSRSNHTGTQTASSISDFVSTVRGSISAGSNVTISSGVISSSANLGLTRNTVSNTITNSAGTGVVLSPASPIEAGVMTAADRNKLDGITANATANPVSTGSPTFLGTWTNFNNGYVQLTAHKMGSHVLLGGLIKGGGNAVGNFALLPAGFRPSGAIRLLVECAGGTATVLIDSGGIMNLAGFSAGSAPNTYLSITGGFWV